MLLCTILYRTIPWRERLEVIYGRNNDKKSSLRKKNALYFGCLYGLCVDQYPTTTHAKNLLIWNSNDCFSMPMFSLSYNNCFFLFLLHIHFHIFAALMHSNQSYSILCSFRYTCCETYTLYTGILLYFHVLIFVFICLFICLSRDFRFQFWHMLWVFEIVEIAHSYISMMLCFKYAVCCCAVLFFVNRGIILYIC